MAAPSLEETSGLKDTLTNLAHYGWYYGNITIEQAERLLRNEPNGSFLVRDCNDPDKLTELYTITFKVNGCFGSCNVDYAKGLFSLCLDDTGLPLFRQLSDLVHHSIHRSVVDKEPVCTVMSNWSGQETQLFLKKPINRFRTLHSLQYHCRAKLHEMYTRDKLELLPLPQRLKENYVLKSPYYEDRPSKTLLSNNHTCFICGL